jgi:hypothetical protein
VGQLDVGTASMPRRRFLARQRAAAISVQAEVPLTARKA